MTVVKGKRKESKVEFDNNYFRIYEDAIRIINNNFGASNDKISEYKYYVQVTSKEILYTLSEIGRQIRIANSIYPTFEEEYRERRLAQDKAIGLCYDLLTKYQLVMKFLCVKDDKYVVEIKNVIHEINVIKKWRTSDNKRFKELG